jgi:hypothetical protein
MNNFAHKGYWYALPNDAHAAFFVADQMTHSKSRIDLELNGPQKTFTITSANGVAAGRKTDESFEVLFGDGHSSKSFSTVDPGDQLTVTINHIDMLSLNATFTGTLTEMGMMERNGHDTHHVTVSGNISLRRASAPAQISARLDSEDTVVNSKAQMNPSAPRLSIQTIAVYVNCDHNLATKAIQLIQWDNLRALPGK